MNPKTFLLLVFFFYKVSSLPIGQLKHLDDLSPIENLDDDSESFVNVLHINENTTNKVTVPDDIINDVTSDDDLEEIYHGTDKPLRIGLSIATTAVDGLITTEESGKSETETVELSSIKDIENLDTAITKVDISPTLIPISIKAAENLDKIDILSTNQPNLIQEIENVDTTTVKTDVTSTYKPISIKETENVIDTTTVKLNVEDKTVNIGFKKNFISEESKTTTSTPTWKTSTVRNVEVVTEEIIPVTQKLTERFGDDLNVVEEIVKQPEVKKLELKESKSQKLEFTESEPENNPHGYQPAIFNGVFAIGRSDYAPESSTSPKPGSFGASFLNLAKHYDSRYKYKYSWSFSGIEKTTPKPPEADGPLFNQKFLAKLTSSNGNIKLDATNLSETGSITRVNPVKISDYKGLSLYKPSVGSYL